MSYKIKRILNILLGVFLIIYYFIDQRVTRLNTSYVDYSFFTKTAIILLVTWFVFSLILKYIEHKEIDNLNSGKDFNTKRVLIPVFALYILISIVPLNYELFYEDKVVLLDETRQSYVSQVSQAQVNSCNQVTGKKTIFESSKENVVEACGWTILVQQDNYSYDRERYFGSVAGPENSEYSLIYYKDDLLYIDSFKLNGHLIRSLNFDFDLERGGELKYIKPKNIKSYTDEFAYKEYNGKEVGINGLLSGYEFIFNNDDHYVLVFDQLRNDHTIDKVGNPILLQFETPSYGVRGGSSSGDYGVIYTLNNDGRVTFAYFNWYNLKWTYLVTDLEIDKITPNDFYAEMYFGRFLMGYNYEGSNILLEVDYRNEVLNIYDSK